MVVMLIGERPGLSAADSLGVYLPSAPGRGAPTPTATASPTSGRTGWRSLLAARKLAFLMTEARRLKLSGVGLKDDVPAELLEPQPVKPALENTAIRERIMINLA